MIHDHGVGAGSVGNAVVQLLVVVFVVDVHGIAVRTAPRRLREDLAGDEEERRE